MAKRKTVTRFGIKWTFVRHINNVAFYESQISKDDYAKFRVKKGYQVIPSGESAEIIVPKAHKFLGDEVEISYLHGRLVMSVNERMKNGKV